MLIKNVLILLKVRNEMKIKKIGFFNCCELQLFLQVIVSDVDKYKYNRMNFFFTIQSRKS